MLLKISWQSLVVCKASTAKSTENFRSLHVWELMFPLQLSINYLMVTMLSVCPCRFLLFDAIWNSWVWNSIYSLKVRKFSAIISSNTLFLLLPVPHLISATLIVSMLYLVVIHKAFKQPWVFFSFHPWKCMIYSSLTSRSPAILFAWNSLLLKPLC